MFGKLKFLRVLPWLIGIALLVAFIYFYGLELLFLLGNLFPGLEPIFDFLFHWDQHDHFP